MAFNTLGAVTAEYTIKSLGLKIAFISINQNQAAKRVEVKTHSLKTSALFPQINNIYQISYDELYRPLTYNRIVKQKGLSDEVSTSYNFGKLSASSVRSSDKSVYNYTLSSHSRDVFSFLMFVSSGQAKAGKYNIDGNGYPWQASLANVGMEEVKTDVGKYKANRWTVTFNNLSGNKTPYVDMVTNNLLNEGTKLNMWVAKDGLVVKATVKKKGITANWDLVRVLP